MKAQILKMLREADGYISGQQLCEKFGVSRTAVWKVIRQLQEEGYEVEAVRNKGYRIIDSPDVMTKEELESLMDTKWAGKNIVYYDEVDSRICGSSNWEMREQWKALWQLLTGRQPEEAGGEGHGIHRQEKVFPCRSY